MKFKKIKAGALLYAVVMTAVFSMMGSALLMNGFFGQIILASATRPQLLYRNAISGINLDMELQGGNTFSADLYGNGTDSVALSSGKWGAYTLLHSKASQNGDVLELIGFAGETTNNKTGLYIINSERPLSVCGKTIINGDCYIPGAGIKRAYIEGKSFEGNKLMNGNLYDAKKQTAQLFDKELNKEILAFLEDRNSLTDSIIVLSSVQPGDSLIESFKNKTIVIYSGSSMLIDEITLRGNIILIARNEIIVNSTAKLEDVILFARNIHFKEKCKVRLQAFATDTIIADKECIFNYPTVIALLDKQQNKNNPLIRLSDNCRVTGDIFSLSKYNSNISLENKCEITGNIYSSGAVDVKGSIHGSLYCGAIVLKTASSYYENHLLDAEIDVFKKPFHYAGVVCTSEKKNKKIIKWVN